MRTEKKKWNRSMDANREKGRNEGEKTEGAERRGREKSREDVGIGGLK